MEKTITYVGLDVHKDSISVTMLVPGKEASEWKLGNTAANVRSLARKLKRSASGELLCCYEAGPCGYVLQRQLDRQGVACQVIAPSLIPYKPGERVKTDRRDARKLAELLRGELLTEVKPPTPEEEAIRDLCRCREDARADLMRCRHRLGKFLLRRGTVWTEGSRWTQGHHRWLRSLRFDDQAEQTVLDDYLLAVEQLGERKRCLDQTLKEMSEQPAYQERVGWLRCFRGIDTITAMAILAELHGFERFTSPRALMAYLGLTPSEHSSGGKQSRGAITKTGNSHLRRLFVEAAWHYRHKPRAGLTLKKRREGQPRWAVTLAERAERRLHRRLWGLMLKGNKPAPKASVAVARELTGFIWAALSGTAASS